MTSNFEIVLAVREDIPRLTRIHVNACKADKAFRLFFKSDEEYSKRITDMLQGQIGESTWTHVKIVDPTTGDIAAWASWNRPTDAQIHDRDVKQEQALKTESSSQSGKSDGLGECKFDFSEGLASYIFGDTERWVNE